MTDANPDMQRAALWYARQGVPVIPMYRPTEEGCSCGNSNCASPGKHPRTLHGFKDATADEACIRRWWSKWPDANIGVPTGALSGLLVVDVDPRNGGSESLESLVLEYGRWPETAEQITGGGGRHIVFGYDGGPVPKNLAEGIDLKGDGGCFVVAPSLHSSGKRYAWDGMDGPKALLKLAEAPQWLLNHIAQARDYSNSNGAVPRDLPEVIPDGEKHDTIVSFAGSVRHRGLPKQAAFAACRVLQFESPVSDEDIWERIESVYRLYPANHTFEAARGQNEVPFAQWPDPLVKESFYGIAGELVRLIEPHSEADPAALLVQFLVCFGSLIGRRAHFMAEADKHYTNLFAVIVGQTAKGRKGTSLGQIRRPLAYTDATWSDGRVMGGLSSGEGLIWAVRDEIKERSPIKEKGRIVGYEDVISDAGEADKRLLVVEPEFARVLQVIERESNTLSAIMRQAWDTGNLRILTKKQAARATEAHISIIGHITRDELRRLLTDTAAGNGFANRILWVCARRSKVLPDGGALDTVDFAPIIQRIKDAVSFASSVDEMRRDGKAREIWHAVYPELSEGKPGLLGTVTSRAESQVMRLACIFALLDCSDVIRAEHMMAALAVWKYCENSARFIFGDSLGDATADEVLRALRQRAGGMTRNDIREHFSRNKSSAEIGRALAVLQEHGLANMVRDPAPEGQGRSAERWIALTGVRG